MASPDCDRAIQDALHQGRAILKFVSANDTGITGAHQCGFYLPKDAWKLFADFAPVKGRNREAEVRIVWPDGLVTASCVKWYGEKTRREYRLTRFGRDFPWLTPDLVGALFVLIPVTHTEFLAYVLDRDDDIEDLQAALGVDVVGRWSVYDASAEVVESEDACLDRHFRVFVQALEALPEGRAFSQRARDALRECVKGFEKKTADQRLVRWVQEEYRLFKMAERQVFGSDVQRLFKDIDDFLKTAMSILQARKSRAGRALENHVEHLFAQSGVPFQMRQNLDGTKPDIIIPSKAAYDDRRYPVERLIVVGVKTTCKDRWRQVLNEAPRIPKKHILTLQEGISTSQLREMKDAQITLVVPLSLQKSYPDPRPLRLLDVGAFIEQVRRLHPGG